MSTFWAGWLDALAASAPAVFFRASMVGYATLNAAHILALALVVGSIATLDLRVLGAFRSAPLGVLARPLTRVAAGGLLLAVITGLLLFSVRPGAYLANPAFLTKIALVAFGTINALALRVNRSWQSALDGAPVGASIKIAAILSLASWTAAILAGRWIGFLQ